MRKPDPHKHDAIIALACAGVLPDAIAAALGTHTPRTVAVILSDARKRGVPVPRQKTGPRGPVGPRKPALVPWHLRPEGAAAWTAYQIEKAAA